MHGEHVGLDPGRWIELTLIGVDAHGMEVDRRALTEHAVAAGTPRLTERETEVLRLVAKGLSYKQIAERLVLSHRTVQNHVQNTLRKLQLHNRVQLVRYAIEQGLDEQ